MNETFIRTAQLLGDQGFSRLSSSVVAVFGLGGVGSHCAEALARSGVGTLFLIDSDTVAPSNINRQSIAYHSTVGRYKTQVMKERILDINPDARVITFETFVLPDNLSPLLDSIPCLPGADRPIDYIIDAIDTVTAKLAIVQYANDHGIPLISSMGTGNKLHGELFEITDITKTSVCPLCRVMRRELKKRGIAHLKVLYSREEPLTPVMESEEAGNRRSVPGSISFVPPAAGLLIAGEAVRDLLKETLYS